MSLNLILLELNKHLLDQPKLVKKNITGSGVASKDQVKEMVKKLLNVNPKNEDSSDALAVAISSQAYSPSKINKSIYSANNLNEAIKKALIKENLQS